MTASDGRISGVPTFGQNEASDLVAFALKVLPSMRLPSGLYCFDRTLQGEQRGESVRYSLMVLIGLQRAAMAGYPVGAHVDELFALCLDRRSSFTPGDIGLALWSDARRECAMAPQLLGDLECAVPNDAALGRLVGMEIAWLIIGLAHAAEHVPAALAPLRRVAEHLCRRRTRAGLYRHDSRTHLRGRLPNFATEIYTVLALAVLARTGLDDSATCAAQQLADQLLCLQLPDGGWPWLFDAKRASVVERYEIYSVHQDAMAPMAFLELSAVTGDSRYCAAAARGLPWSRGHNELGVNLLDRDVLFAHRSIRRRPPWDRVAQAVNCSSGLSIGRPLWPGGSRVELNRTCRPYHLGWILEAWAGRERALGTINHD